MCSGRRSRKSSTYCDAQTAGSRCTPNRGIRLWFSNPRFPRDVEESSAYSNATFCHSVRHREDQNAIVSLIGKHSQICELVYGNAELRRTAEPERAAGLKRVRKRVNDGNGLTRGIHSHDAA